MMASGHHLLERLQAMHIQMVFGIEVTGNGCRPA